MKHGLGTTHWSRINIPGFSRLLEQRFAVWHWRLDPEDKHIDESVADLAKRLNLPADTLGDWIDATTQIHQHSMLTLEIIYGMLNSIKLPIIWLDLRSSAALKTHPITGVLAIHHHWFHRIEAQLCSGYSIICISDRDWQALSAVCYLKDRGFPSVYYARHAFPGIDCAIYPEWQQAIETRPSSIDQLTDSSGPKG